MGLIWTGWLRNVFLLQSALQDELHLRLDFLLVTCLRGNDYLPQLAFLADPVALGRETSRPILC